MAADVVNDFVIRTTAYETDNVIMTTEDNGHVYAR